MQATIYIRKENEDKWNDIADKSNWVNTLLDNSGSTKEYGAVRETPAGKMTTVPSEALPEIPGVVRGSDFVPKPPDPETGYPCCQKRSPCKHWTWDGNIEAWINSPTGKTRES